MSADPLYWQAPGAVVGSPLEAGLYGYALNSPLAFLDPTGLGGIDLGEELTSVSGVSNPETDERRFLEIWNLVFMQFEQQAGGKRTNNSG